VRGNGNQSVTLYARASKLMGNDEFCLVGNVGGSWKMLPQGALWDRYMRKNTFSALGELIQRCPRPLSWIWWRRI